MKRVLSLVVLLILAASCAEKIDVTFPESEEIRLEIGGKPQMSYDESLGQLGFNSRNCCFSVMNDSASDYFVITLERMPATVDEIIMADLCWTTPSSIENRKNIAFLVLRLEGDTVWLYNCDERIGVCVRKLV